MVGAAGDPGLMKPVRQGERVPGQGPRGGSDLPLCPRPCPTPLILTTLTPPSSRGES